MLDKKFVVLYDCCDCAVAWGEIYKEKENYLEVRQKGGAPQSLLCWLKESCRRYREKNEALIAFFHKS